MVPEVATSNTSPENPAGLRAHAYAETYRLTLVDRFGVWLSLRQILRWANEPAGKVIGDFGAGYRAPLVRALLDLSLIHISEPTRLLSISYAVFCLKKK